MNFNVTITLCPNLVAYVVATSDIKIIWILCVCVVHSVYTVPGMIYIL